MFSATTYVIREAESGEDRALARHASLVGETQLKGTVLIGELDGIPAVALSVDDGRIVADPFRQTDGLVVQMRSRARARKAYERTPSVRERIRSGVRLAA